MDVQKTKGELIYGSICTALFTAGLGYLFIYFATTEGQYGGDCTSLKYWAYVYGFVCVLTLVISLQTLLPACCLEGSSFQACFLLNKSIVSLLGIVLLVLFIILNVAFFKGEDCGNLRTLTKIYLIIVYVILLLSCCCLCCFLPAFMAVGTVAVAVNHQVEEEERQNLAQQQTEQPQEEQPKLE